VAPEHQSIWRTDTSEQQLYAVKNNKIQVYVKEQLLTI
jgi:hypothetical protein